ncbi:MAG: hypothetical protein ACYSUI_04755 [Planctomycetota bacterium]|jgi:hypothetical protein
MSPKDLLELLKAEPFEPFELQLSTGEKLTVPHPENLLVGRTKCYLPIFKGEIVDRMVYIALNHIATIEIVDGRAGKGSKRKSES